MQPPAADCGSTNRAVLLNRTEMLEVSDFPEKLQRPERMPLVKEAEAVTPTLESIEKAYIHYVMSQTEGKKAEAAKILGIDTSTLYRKIERYDMKKFSNNGTGGQKSQTKRK